MKFEEPWDRPLLNFYLYYAEELAAWEIASWKYVVCGGSALPRFFAFKRSSMWGTADGKSDVRVGLGCPTTSFLPAFVGDHRREVCSLSRYLICTYILLKDQTGP